MKICILGAPGSGKSCFARSLLGLISNVGVTSNSAVSSKATGSHMKHVHDLHGDGVSMHKVNQHVTRYATASAGATNDKNARMEVYECSFPVSMAASHFREEATMIGELFENATAIAITYDVTNGHSFDSACSVYYPLVDRFASEESFVMLIGTKSDRIRERAVGIEEVEGFASLHGLFFMEISSVDMTNVQLTLNILSIHANTNFKEATTPTLINEGNSGYHEGDDDDLEFSFPPPPPPPLNARAASKSSPKTISVHEAAAEEEYARVQEMFASANIGKSSSKIPRNHPPPPPPPPPPQQPKSNQSKPSTQASSSSRLARKEVTNSKMPKSKVLQQPISIKLESPQPKSISQKIVDNRAVLSRIDVVVGKGKSVSVFIREGDRTPQEVVENFKKENGFRSQKIADLVLAEVTRAFSRVNNENVNIDSTRVSPNIRHDQSIGDDSIELRKNLVQPESARLTKAQKDLLFKTMGMGSVPAPSPMRANAKTAAPLVQHKSKDPLFSVDVSIGGDKVEKITYHDGEDFEDVARSFCDEHHLPESKIGKLSALLKATYEKHMAR